MNEDIQEQIVVRASEERDDGDVDIAVPHMCAELETAHDEDETVFLALDAYEPSS